VAEPAAARRSPRSWWARLRQDTGRRIERRGFVIWYLIFERGIRGIAVLGLGLYLFTVSADRLPAAVESFEAQLGLGEGGGNWIQQLVQEALSRVASLSARGVVLIAAGSVLYGLLELVEAGGLALRRRWAEYLVVVATGFGIPLEIRAVLVHVTWLRFALLAINIAIVVYLVQRKRLFILDEGGNT